MKSTIVVRGFDFETTEDAIVAHCSVAGEITGVRFKKKGTALVTYTSPDEAASAVAQLQGSHIDGQQRYIDVYLDGQGPGGGGGGGGGGPGKAARLADDEVERFIADHGLDDRAAKALRTEPAAVVRHVIERGPLVGCANPSSAVMSRLRDAGREVGHFAAAGPPAKAARASPSSAPAVASGPRPSPPQGPSGPRGAAAAANGGCVVNVHNIDFGSSQAVIEQHFGTAGEIVGFRFKNKGTAQITFATPDEAQAAIDVLSGTILDGGERVIEVRLAGKGGGGGSGPTSAVGPSANLYPTENGMAARAAPMPPSGRPTFTGAGVWEAKRKFSSGAVPGPRDDAHGPLTKRRKLRKRREQMPAWAYGTDGRRVYIRGFDFDTPEDRIREHVERAGKVQNLCMMSQGSALAVYHTQAAAKEAVRKLDRSTIAGNQRYVEVKLDTRSMPEGGANGEDGDGEEGELEGEDDEGEQAMDEEDLAKQLLEAEDADSVWQRTLAEAWEQFCAAKPPAARTVGSFLNGLPDDAKLALKVKGTGGR